MPYVTLTHIFTLTMNTHNNIRFMRSEYFNFIFAFCFDKIGSFSGIYIFLLLNLSSTIKRYFTILSTGACPTGTFYSAQDDMCKTCAMNSYSDQDGMLSCEICPKGSVTQQTGSTRSSDCVGKCTVIRIKRIVAILRK